MEAPGKLQSPTSGPGSGMAQVSGSKFLSGGVADARAGGVGSGARRTGLLASGAVGLF